MLSFLNGEMCIRDRERLMREISGLAKFGYFCVGLFGGLFGVLAAWFMGKDGWGWSEGGKLFAWFGCLFWLIAVSYTHLIGWSFSSSTRRSLSVRRPPREVRKPGEKDAP